jgi:hypothetical protein
MPIAFACNACGTTYSVDAKLAGRKAKCKSCAQMMTIPLRPGVSAAVAVGAGAPAGGGADRLFPTNIGLAPLDADEGYDGKGPKKTYSFNPALLEKTQPGLYGLVPTAQALPSLARRKPGGSPPNPMKAFWRNLIGGPQKAVRKISDFVYLLSVPCILAFLIGILLRKESIAYPAAVAIVALNIGRFVLNGVYLLAVPIKEGPVTGALFFFPPFTVYYLITHWNKMEKPFRRFLLPLLPIAIVVVAFIFIPWLHTGGQDDKIEALREKAETVAGSLAPGSPAGGR